MKMLDYFQAFLADTVNLNKTRLDQLDSRYSAIFEALKAAPELDGRVLDAVPQGSWAHRTIIRPPSDIEFDADFLLQLAHDPTWETDPRSYANAVWDALRGHSTYGTKCSKKDRCLRVTYANDCHVDIVPYVILGTGREVIVNRADNIFEDTNPFGFTNWMQETDALTNGNLRKVIRLLKYLRDHESTFRLKSVLLTTLVGRVVNEAPTSSAGRYTDVPTTLLNVIEDLDAWLQARRYRPELHDPSSPETSFDHRWSDETYRVFRNRIHDLAPKVRAAYDATTPTASIEAWRKVFGQAFPSTVSTSASAASASSPVQKSWTAPARRAPGEAFIEEKFPVNLTHSVRLNCKIAEPRNRAERRALRVRAGRVQKQRRLIFDIVSTDVPEPFDVYWKVRNHGQEARDRGQLRGQIVPDSGMRQRRESTSYSGNHWVECYVVKNGVCVARTQEPVIIP